VKESVKSGKTLRQVVLEKKLLSPAQLDSILSPENLTSPKK
jgi:aspartate ammonia-lyase